MPSTCCSKPCRAEGNCPRSDRPSKSPTVSPRFWTSSPALLKKSAKIEIEQGVQIETQQIADLHIRENCRWQLCRELGQPTFPPG